MGRVKWWRSCKKFNEIDIRPNSMTTLYSLAYCSFCDAYAPKLWGLILKAHLPAPQAEAILLNTLTKAWHQLDSQPIQGNQFLSRLLTLAYQEGLPPESLTVILRPKN